MISCPECQSENTFIERNELSVCRDCGCPITFSWGIVPGFSELKQQILDIAPGEDEKAKLAFLNELKKKRPFWLDDAEGNRLYSQYYNLFIYLKFGPIRPPKDDRTARPPEASELPTARQKATVCRPKKEVKQPALPANGGRKNIGSSGYNSGYSGPVQKGAVRGTPKGANKPSTRPPK